MQTQSALALALYFFITSPFAVAANDAHLKGLLNYFSSTCPTQGQWTKTALAQTGVLIDTFRAMQSDADCRSMSGMVSQLGLIQQKVAWLDSDSRGQELMGLKARRSELLMQIAADPNQASSYQQDLLDLELQIAELQGSLSASDLETNKKGIEALTTSVSATQAVLEQTISNVECVDKHPEILQAVASLAGAVASAVATPIIGVAVSAATELLGITVEAIRKGRYSRQIKKLNQAMSQTAVQCVLESLSNQWCAADESEKIVMLKARAVSQSDTNDALWIGARLQDREIPVFIRWLERIPSGLDPVDSSGGGRQTRFLNRQAAVETTRVTGIGLINEAHPFFDGAQNPLAKWQILKNLIINVLGRSSPFSGAPGPSVSNPLIEVVDPWYIPYLLAGIDKSKVPQANGGPQNFEEFDPFKLPDGYDPSISKLKDQFESWIRLGRNLLDLERNLTFLPDPIEILTQATVKDSTNGLTALKSLDTLIQFLSTQTPPMLEHPSFGRQYQDTLLRLSKIHTKILERLNTTDADDQADQTALLDIFKRSELQFGTTFLKNRLTTAIRFSIEHLISEAGPNRNIPKDEVAILLAADDFMDELGRYRGSLDLNEFLADAKQAKALSSANLQAFTKVFALPIDRALNRLANEAALERNGLGNHTVLLGDLCLKLLAVPELPRSISTKRCYGIQRQSVYPGGPKSISIGEKLFSLPQSNRACEFRKFYRENRIYGRRVGS